MSRIQLALDVTDLDAAIAFYGALFGAEPAKVRPGYANFAIADPPLKLVLIEGERGGTVNHLGVEVPDTDVVASAGARLGEAGVELDERSAEACCYATQDKVWVADPDGARWEVYTVLGDADVMVPTS
ncbi:glyoxalase/bleomycin resistance/dioxygenase family protein [Nitriliruptoraceae bacterium ZYF776]|nr:glyoxalase/bleomycin resistance/dioxygenase family protein [Profundirhabdus halotolerans]